MVRHARHVLVGEHAADGDRVFAGPAASDNVGEKHLGRLRIVTDVDNGGHGIGGDEFEAGRQADLAQTRADVVERDGHAVHQGGDDGEDAARIAVLVDAGERGLGQVLEERRALSERKRAVLLHRHRPVLAREESLRADLLDMIPHRGGHVGVGADGGAAGR